MRHGRRTLRPVESRLRGSIDAGDLGEHGGTGAIVGDAAIGELRRVHVEQAVSPVFHVADARAQLTSGPRLTVTEYSKDSSNTSDLIAIL